MRDLDIRPWVASDGDTRCQRCGQGNGVWFTDSRLWNRVVPQGGILCVPCFIELAEAAGFKPTGWELVPQLRPPTFEQVSEFLHKQHVAEFADVGNHDNLPASECGNCRRWARYMLAAGLIKGALPSV